MKTKAKRWVVAIVGIVVGVGILVGVKAGQIVTMVRAGESMVPPAEGVSSAIETAVRDGLTRAMDLYNRAGSLGCEELP